MYVDEFIQHQVLIIHYAVPATNTETVQVLKKAFQILGKMKILFLGKNNFSPQSGPTAVIPVPQRQKQ